MPGVFMACGCTTHAVDGDGKPVCITHVGISEGARSPAAEPDLSGRTMRCSYDRDGRTERPSDVQAAFFRQHPDREHDEFYCGCWGWD